MPTRVFAPSERLSLDALIARLEGPDSPEGDRARGDAVRELLRRGLSGSFVLAKFFRDDPGKSPDDPATRRRWQAMGILSGLAGERPAPGAPFLDARHEEALLGALDSPHEEIRRLAAVLLGRVGTTKALGPLVERLEDARAPVREAAALALGERAGGDGGEIERRARALLLARVGDETRTVRERAAAARALGDLGAPEAVPALSKLSHSGREALVEAAAEALSRMDSADVVPAAEALLGDDSPRVRSLALSTLAPFALARLGGRYRECLAAAAPATPLPSPSPRPSPEGGESRRGAAESVAASARAAVRAAAARALGELGDAPGELGGLVNDPSATVELEAVRAAGRLRLPAERAEVLRRFARESRRAAVRWQAARALGSLGEEPAAGGALEILLADPSAEVRTAAAESLAIRGAYSDSLQRAYEAAVRRAFARPGRPGETAEAPPPPGPVEERVALLWALGTSGGPYALDPITEALDFGEGPVRAAAFRALAVSRFSRLQEAQEVLKMRAVRALADEDPEVRTAAHLCLVAVTRADLPPKPEAWRAWWEGRALPEAPPARPEAEDDRVFLLALDRAAPLEARREALRQLLWLAPTGGTGGRTARGAVLELAARAGLDEASLRAEALRGLSRMRLSEAAAVLVETIPAETDAELLGETAFALGEVTGHDFRPRHGANPARLRAELIGHWTRWASSGLGGRRGPAAGKPLESPAAGP